MEKQAALRSLKEGSYMMLDGEPSKINKIVFSKPGKHGSAKARIEAVGIFDNKKRSVIIPGGTDIAVPVIEKKGAQVLNVSGDIAQLMDLTDYSTLEARIDEEMKDKVQAGMEITYWKFESKILIKG